MVTILPSNKILVTESNDNIDKINRSSENPSVCPSCKGDNTIITDPKIQGKLSAADVVWCI